MSTRASNLLLLCFGEGGHHAQARRLFKYLEGSCTRMPLRVLCVTDRAGMALQGTEEIVLTPLRRKHASSIGAVVHLGRALASNGRQLVHVMRAARKAQNVVLISVGPSFAVFPALAVKIRGGHVVHIETWSRFTTYSVTGRIMYRLADHFLVQNKELLSLYPGAVYCGRL